jgi:hypothetical protein
MIRQKREAKFVGGEDERKRERGIASTIGKRLECFRCVRIVQDTFGGRERRAEQVRKSTERVVAVVVVLFFLFFLSLDAE